MQELSDEKSQLMSVLDDCWDAGAATPVVVQMSLLVCKNLHLVGLQAVGVVDDVVRCRSDCSLANRLADQEEVIAKKKQKMLGDALGSKKASHRSGSVIVLSTTVPDTGLSTLGPFSKKMRVLMRLETIMKLSFGSLPPPTLV